jgi:hypothetical protein
MRALTCVPRRAEILKIGKGSMLQDVIDLVGVNSASFHTVRPCMMSFRNKQLTYIQKNQVLELKGKAT